MSLTQEAMASADVCLKYYAKHPKDAIFAMHIRSIQPSINPNEFEITLDKKLRYVENLSLRVGKDKLFSNNQAKTHFKIQKADKRTVWLTDVSDKLADALNNVAEEENTQFESDKTFLVKRLKDWYKDYGTLIRIPDTHPSVPVSFHPQIPVSENQKTAVTTAMTSPFSYVWGAPGTGKTKHVLATCIYSCLKEKKKILLSAPTNVALDQSLSGVLQALDGDKELNIRKRVLRLGSPDEGFPFTDLCEDAVYERIVREIRQKIADTLNTITALSKSREIKKGKRTGKDAFPEMTSRQIREKIQQLTKVITDLRSKLNEAEESKSITPFIDQFDIIAATADTCVYRVHPNGTFIPDHVFLDEAGYCSVIKGMIFTAYHCPMTMLGDHMQLPPVCDINPKPGDDISGEEEGKLFLWKFSAIAMEQVIQAQDYKDFHCLKDLDPIFRQLKKSSLIETHRFGPKLASILASTVYDRSFVSSNERETNIWVIDTPKRTEDIGNNPNTTTPIRFSQSEEEAILRIILNNIGSGIIEDMGILTPYTEQRRRLKTDIGKKLKEHHYHNIIQDNIMSVHQSQGSEWNIVMVSVVDSLAWTGSRTDAWMMNTVNGIPNAIKTINTAVSRAKQLLIILCDVNSWKQNPDQFITKIIGIAEKHSADDPFPITMEEEKEEKQSEEKQTDEKDAKEKTAEANEAPVQKAAEYFDRTKRIAIFGSYPQDKNGNIEPIKWRILEEKDNSLLLISDQCLDVRAFSDRSAASFWGRSSVRGWLNNNFLNTAFTARQRESIRQATINNSSEQSDTSMSVLNGVPTKDRVFLLSYLEAKHYFPDDKSREAQPTAYALSLLPSEGRADCNPRTDSKNRWLLRSNSQDAYKISVVDQFGRLGRRCGMKSRRMIRPAIWVETSKMTEIKTPDCLICGAKGTGLICHNCMNGKALDQFVTRIEAAPSDHLQTCIPGVTDKTIYYRMIKEELTSPWKEYFTLVVMSSGRYYISKSSTEEVIELCSKIHQHGRGLDQYAANRVGGLLLYIRMLNHDYSEAEEIAKKLYKRANMPYQAYCGLALFYLKTRRFDLAAFCIERVRAEYSEDASVIKWLDKIVEEYNVRSRAIRNYTPTDKVNQQKLLEFLESIGKT